MCFLTCHWSVFSNLFSDFLAGSKFESPLRNLSWRQKSRTNSWTNFVLLNFLKSSGTTTNRPTGFVRTAKRSTRRFQEKCWFWSQHISWFVELGDVVSANGGTWFPSSPDLMLILGKLNPTPHKDLVGKNIEKKAISHELTRTVPIEWNMIPLCWSKM